MANKSITRVSVEDIQKELGQSTTKTAEESNPISYQKPQSYIDKLKDNEIKEYFSQFGYINHSKTKLDDADKFSALNVLCDSFSVLLSDYDIIIKIELQPQLFSQSTKNDFNIFELVKYCEAIEMPLEKVLADKIQIEFLGQRFPSYGKNFSKRKQDERKKSYENLSKPMQKMFKTINEKKEHEINSIANKLHYGTFDAEQETKTTL